MRSALITLVLFQLSSPLTKHIALRNGTVTLVRASLFLCNIKQTLSSFNYINCLFPIVIGCLGKYSRLLVSIP